MAHYCLFIMWYSTLSKLTAGSFLAGLVVGCAAAPTVAIAPPKAEIIRKPLLRVIYRHDQAFARVDGREWKISEVARNEMLWAPDGRRFAYVKKTQIKTKAKANQPRYRIVIRNMRGDSVNAFPVYRPGRPSDLDWLDDEHLSYLAPPDRSGSAYVVHSARTGSVLNVYRGHGFAWSPGRKKVAFVTGKKRQEIRVSGERIWPRGAASVSKRRIVSELVWSPDGGGIAFMERRGRTTRLVVLLVIDNRGGDLSWPLPEAARDPKNRLFWAENKLVIGESSLKPRFAASWRRLQ